MSTKTASLQTYYLLTKPGIIIGNLITSVAGFVLASYVFNGAFDLKLFLYVLLGLGPIIASACVFNNYIDRFSDAKMARTKNRPLAKGSISPRTALLYATLIGIFGTIILSLHTHPLALIIALAGFFIYVVVYSLWKYRSTYGTLLVGSISGAMPPLVGYCAVSHQLDLGAILLFTVLLLWQMPHFFSITLYRIDDYAAASIPVLPIKKGIPTTQLHMLLYIIAFMLATPLCTIAGYTGVVYLVGTTLMGAAWLGLCIQGFKTTNVKLWARKMFLFSLLVITLLCSLLSLDVVRVS